MVITVRGEKIKILPVDKVESHDEGDTCPFCLHDTVTDVMRSGVGMYTCTNCGEEW